MFASSSVSFSTLSILPLPITCRLSYLFTWFRLCVSIRCNLKLTALLQVHLKSLTKKNYLWASQAFGGNFESGGDAVSNPESIQTVKSASEGELLAFSPWGEAGFWATHGY